MDRWKRSKVKSNIDHFVHYDKVKWREGLKNNLQRGRYAQFDGTKCRRSMYRAFCRKFLFFDRVLLERIYGFAEILPSILTESENRIICVSEYGRKEFSVFLTQEIPNLNFYADPAQCFPFYTYNEDGSHRRENITDWALLTFRNHYNDPNLTKWDIFYYIYGLLHSPDYRNEFVENLRRALPHIPFTPNFQAFTRAGKRLAQLHLDYEVIEPYPLQWIETPAVPLSYYVEKMRLSNDKMALKVNDSLTLINIPPEVFHYRLGNRSALEWVIDQYQVKQEKRTGIHSDPNRRDDEEYIVRLVGQVVRVSIETIAIVQGLPTEFLPPVLPASTPATHF